MVKVTKNFLQCKSV